jgi:hypothetical protein
MDLPLKPSSRHSPTIFPLQSRTPFFLPPRSSPTASFFPFSPRTSSSRRPFSSALSKLRLLFPSRYSRLLPRSKARFVLIVVMMSTIAFGVLVSMSILNLDLPPIDEYDQPNKGLKKEKINRSFEGQSATYPPLRMQHLRPHWTSFLSFSL